MALSDSYKAISSEEFTHFDKVISVQLLTPKGANSPWGSVTIAPEAGGPKPNISFSTQMLPGGIATEFKLTIYNFTAEADIGIFSHMVITIGYRTSPKRREFTAAIFSGYIESPNPNGRTVFTGLVGDWFIAALTEVNRNIVFREPTVTIGALLWGIVEGKGANGQAESPDVKNGGLGLSLKVDLPPWVLNDKILVGKDGQKETSYWTESGYACLNWLIDRISSYGDILVSRLRAQGLHQDEAELYRVMATLQDNVVFVFMKGFTKSLDPNIIEYIDLNHVTSVAFQGAALNVIAPWNPLVMPGSLFHMESRYFRGRMSPGQVIRESARDSSDLYRVITMGVDYDTFGAANSMKLLAIRNDSFASTEAQAERMTAIDRQVAARSNVYVDPARVRDITFGRDRPLEEGERKSLWGVTKTTISSSAGTIRRIRAGESLGSIALESYGSLKYYKTPSQGNIDHVNEYVSGAYYWPLIAIGNYCMALNEAPGFENYTEAPEQLVEGQSVFIPTATNLDSLTSLHDILENMADQFESSPDNTWGVNKQDIYYIRLICYFMELV